MSFLFNDTATTEIYTYGHTRSLHAALPIFCGEGCRRRFRNCRPNERILQRSATLRSCRNDRCRAGSTEGRRYHESRNREVRRNKIDISGRSEEHTSELKSLLRISYAVFCLKKKKSIKHQR